MMSQKTQVIMFQTLAVIGAFFYVKVARMDKKYKASFIFKIQVGE